MGRKRRVLASLGRMVKWSLKHGKRKIKISEIKGDLSLNELARVADKYHLADILIGKKKLTLISLRDIDESDESLIKASDVPELKGESVLKEAVETMAEIDDDGLFAIREEDNDFSVRDEILEPKKKKKKKKR